MITVSRRPLSVASFADMALFAAFCIASMLLAVSIQLGPYGVPTRSAVLFAVEIALITTAVGTMFGLFRSGERKSLGTLFGRTVLAMGVGVPICYVIFGMAPQGAGPRAVLPYAALFTVSIDDILDAVRSYACHLVEVTGGEPLAQPDTSTLLRRLCDEEFTVLLETSGAVDTTIVDPSVRIILDVKCPGSGMMERMHWPNVERLRPQDEAKFVIQDRNDYEWATSILNRFQLTDRCPVLFSPVFGLALDPRQLAEWLLADRLPIRLQLQTPQAHLGTRYGGSVKSFTVDRDVDVLRTNNDQLMTLAD